VALVTGAGRAGQIGPAVARGLGSAGAKVVIAARDARELEARAAELASAGITVAVAAGDLATPEGARAAVRVATERFGRLDVLVNVAGGLLNYGPVTDVALDAFDREFSANARTVFLVTQAAIPALRAAGGAVVNFASIAVSRPQARMVSYTAAKAAVAGMTQAFAKELTRDGIRVNAVAPSLARTAQNLADLKDDPKAKWVELADIVNAVLFLAGEESRGITGRVVPLTGQDL